MPFWSPGGFELTKGDPQNDRQIFTRSGLGRVCRPVRSIGKPPRRGPFIPPGGLLPKSVVREPFTQAYPRGSLLNVYSCGDAGQFASIKKLGQSRETNR